MSRIPRNLTAGLLALAVLSLATPALAQYEKTANVYPAFWDAFFVKPWDQLPIENGMRTFDVVFEEAANTENGPSYTLSGTQIIATECDDSWVVGPMTASDLHNYLTITQSRILDLELLKQEGWPGVGEPEYFAVVRRNLGEHAKTWWWFVNVDFDTLDYFEDYNDARLIDLEHLGGNPGIYAAVMIANTGDDYLYSVAEVGKTESEIYSIVGVNTLGRLIHLDFEGVSGRERRWNYIMVYTDEIEKAEPYFDRPAANLLAIADEDDMRISMMDRIAEDRYGAILVSTRPQPPIIPPP